jgi:hypothetical protein
MFEGVKITNKTYWLRNWDKWNRLANKTIKYQENIDAQNVQNIQNVQNAIEQNLDIN